MEYSGQCCHPYSRGSPVVAAQSHTAQATSYSSLHSIQSYCRSETESAQLRRGATPFSFGSSRAYPHGRPRPPTMSIPRTEQLYRLFLSLRLVIAPRAYFQLDRKRGVYGLNLGELKGMSHRCSGMFAPCPGKRDVFRSLWYMYSVLLAC